MVVCRYLLFSIRYTKENDFKFYVFNLWSISKYFRRFFICLREFKRWDVTGYLLYQCFIPKS